MAVHGDIAESGIGKVLRQGCGRIHGHIADPPGPFHPPRILRISRLADNQKTAPGRNTLATSEKARGRFFQKYTVSKATAASKASEAQGRLSADPCSTKQRTPSSRRLRRRANATLSGDGSTPQATPSGHSSRMRRSTAPPPHPMSSVRHDACQGRNDRPQRWSGACPQFIPRSMKRPQKPSGKRVCRKSLSRKEFCPIIVRNLRRTGASPSVMAKVAHFSRRRNTQKCGFSTRAGQDAHAGNGPRRGISRGRRRCR